MLPTPNLGATPNDPSSSGDCDCDSTGRSIISPPCVFIALSSAARLLAGNGASAFECCCTGRVGAVTSSPGAARKVLGAVSVGGGGSVLHSPVAALIQRTCPVRLDTARCQPGGGGTSDDLEVAGAATACCTGLAARADAEREPRGRSRGRLDCRFGGDWRLPPSCCSAWVAGDCRRGRTGEESRLAYLRCRSSRSFRCGLVAAARRRACCFASRVTSCEQRT